MARRLPRLRCALRRCVASGESYWLAGNFNAPPPRPGRVWEQADPPRGRPLLAGQQIQAGERGRDEGGAAVEQRPGAAEEHRHEQGAGDHRGDAGTPVIAPSSQVHVKSGHEQRGQHE